LKTQAVVEPDLLGAPDHGPSTDTSRHERRQAYSDGILGDHAPTHG